ncbi:hypothetical protein AOQ84DRAFT_392011 [Glonium stellatum]|uniref:Uncharacterized protein n=1 Tax=Glonium stellatum TaxID=574774 RepID=A0A8E2JP01_9PEZI|nr:hypothetical protein AOQ84DRAFT_392011 [Glonium stellatum]
MTAQTESAADAANSDADRSAAFQRARDLVVRGRDIERVFFDGPVVRRAGGTLRQGVVRGEGGEVSWSEVEALVREVVRAYGEFVEREGAGVGGVQVEGEGEMVRIEFESLFGDDGDEGEHEDGHEGEDEGENGDDYE